MERDSPRSNTASLSPRSNPGVVLPQYTQEEVSQHNTSKSLWLIIANEVYDVTTYHKRHPGGAAVMFNMAGKDATAQAFAAHSRSRQKKPEQIMKQFHIGSVAGPLRRPSAIKTDADVADGSFKKAGDKQNKLRHGQADDDEEGKPKKSAYAGGGGSARYATKTIVTDDFEEALYGEEAMVATADLLYQRLRMDKRLVRFMNGNNNLRQLALRLRYFLAGAFETPQWPEMKVTDDGIKGCVSDLADVISDALKQPLPLGDDPLAAALHSLSDKEWQADPRIVGFYQHIRGLRRLPEEQPAAPLETLAEELAEESEIGEEESISALNSEAATETPQTSARGQLTHSQSNISKGSSQTSVQSAKASQPPAKASQAATGVQSAKPSQPAAKASQPAAGVQAAKKSQPSAKASQPAAGVQSVKQSQPAARGQLPRPAPKASQPSAGGQSAQASQPAAARQSPREPSPSVPAPRAPPPPSPSPPGPSPRDSTPRDPTPREQTPREPSPRVPTPRGESPRGESPREVVSPKVSSQKKQKQKEEQEEVVEHEESEREEEVVEDRDEYAETARYSGGTVDTQHFGELQLTTEVVDEMRETWNLLLARVETKEAAGEAIYAALFESAPSLQSLFKTPRAVQAMKFINSFLGFVRALHDPVALKTNVETLGFAHLHLEITVPRVIIFRDAILDLFMVELGPKLTSEAGEGWCTLLNYIGGGLIYIKVNYAERIETLMQSWEIVSSKKQKNSTGYGGSETRAGEAGGNESADRTFGSKQVEKKGKLASAFTNLTKKSGSHGKDGNDDKMESHTNGHNASFADNSNSQVNIPQTYNDMFLFNAAVMGFAKHTWMQEVLQCFDPIVTSVNNTSRLQEECQMLALRMSTHAAQGHLRLADYKACMLASLRSLLPKDWSPAHEIAWTWLWENVERLLEANMYDPPQFAKHLARLWQGLDVNELYELRKEIFTNFFVVAPTGQEYFKQSNTRLHFIAEKVLQMTLEIYEDPVKMIDDLASLGLRHVGYAIPLDLFGPFVSSCVEVVGRRCTKDEVALQAFRWSLGLITKTLVRTIEEGSTIVMNAVNENSEKMLRKAISCAPRGERNQWMLRVDAGAQTISPLVWGIESGRLAAAEAIIKDLLTIRADRETYYYGMEDLFRYFPDVVTRLTADAPSLLPPLLQGLVWRSRITQGGMRRVNSYLKYFVVDHEGNFSNALKAIVSSQDPTIMSDPVIVLCSETLWKRLVKRLFLSRKMWFILSLLCFVASQAVLPNMKVSADWKQPKVIVLCILRLINYLSTMRVSAMLHIRSTLKDYRKQKLIRVWKFSLPMYLQDRYQQCNLMMLFLLMTLLAHEPLLWCASDPKWPVDECHASRDVESRYEVVSMLAMILIYALCADISVLSTGLSAFMLVCTHVLGEVIQFLIGLTFLLLMFASSMSALRHYHLQFRDVPNTVLTLFSITVMRYEGDYREINDEPVLLGGVFLFVLASSVLLLNLLIAQLNCSYEFVYQDMVGFARLNRAACINDCLATCEKSKWRRFVVSCDFDKKLEFNEGDVGMAGGLQTFEPSSLHPTAEDGIQRYGGTCSKAERWPEEAKDLAKLDRFERLEKMIHKAAKRMVKKVHAASATQGQVGQKGSSSDTLLSSGSGSKMDGDGDFC